MAPATSSTTRRSTCSSSLDLTISVQGFSLSPPQASSVMRDLDINQVPSQLQEEEYINICMMDHELVTTDQDHDDCNNIINGGPRKKLRLTKEQSRLLEESFRHNNTLNTKQKEGLAMELKLRPRQVEVWFQNRRARSKLKQTEMECEYLKRWFGSLTEQNRRLQREVEELRALKVVGPPSPSVPPPPSSLTMCPRCERVSSTSHLLPLPRPPDNKSSSPNPLSSNPTTSP